MNTIHHRAPALLATALLASAASATTVTFEEVSLPGAGFLNQSSPPGGFVVGGSNFRNNYNAGWGSWFGFALSNRTDISTPGLGNQYSAFAGGGHDGSPNYAVGYYSTFDGEGPWITFSSLSSMVGKGAYFTNTTYTAISMLQGDSFSKKFGGTTGDDADWLKLTIESWIGGAATGRKVDFLLADYQDPDNARDYIVQKWTHVDFSPLGDADQLRFTMSSSDNGPFGMNTPSYFAMDTVVVPEPSAALCTLAGLTLLLRRKR